MNKEQLSTIENTSKITGVSGSSLYIYILTGRIQHYKNTDNDILLYPQDVINLSDNKKVSTKISTKKTQPKIEKTVIDYGLLSEKISENVASLIGKRLADIELTMGLITDEEYKDAF